MKFRDCTFKCKYIRNRRYSYGKSHAGALGKLLYQYKENKGSLQWNLRGTISAIFCLYTSFTLYKKPVFCPTKLNSFVLIEVFNCTLKVAVVLFIACVACRI